MSNQTKWSIDPSHSEINFKVKHMMISTVTGSFESFDATAHTEGDDFKGASIRFSAQTSSVNTKNKDRDQHLMSDDFFNSQAYPELTFQSTSFDGQKLTGDVSIRGISKEVILDVDFNGIAVDPYGQTKAGFEIRGKVNRKDFDLKWSAVTEAGSIVVSDTVKLLMDIQLIKQA